jgi:hypothetical protein
MEMKEICPCVNLDCPNFGNCENCTSRHLNKGDINYCAFFTVLPELEEAIAASPESQTAQKLAFMIKQRLENYDKLMKKHDLTKEGQAQLLKKMADYSDY